MSTTSHRVERRRPVEGDAHHPSGHAAAAVAADDVTRSHAGGVTVTAELDGHCIGGFFAGRHRTVPPHLDVFESVQTSEQFGVDERLHEAVALRPAETCIGRGHFGKHPALGVDETQNLVGHGVRQDTVDQAYRLEGAQRLVVQSHPTRVVDECVSFLDHQCADTLQAKDIGQRQSDRAGTDDHARRHLRL